MPTNTSTVKIEGDNEFRVLDLSWNSEDGATVTKYEVVSGLPMDLGADQVNKTMRLGITVRPGGVVEIAGINEILKRSTDGAKPGIRRCLG